MKRPADQSDVVLRSAITLLRQFCFAEELKELIAVDTDTAETVLMVLKQRSGIQIWALGSMGPRKIKKLPPK